MDGRVIYCENDNDGIYVTRRHVKRRIQCVKGWKSHKHGINKEYEGVHGSRFNNGDHYRVEFSAGRTVQAADNVYSVPNEKRRDCCGTDGRDDQCACNVIE